MSRISIVNWTLGCAAMLFAGRAEACPFADAQHCQEFEDVVEYVISDRAVGNGMVAADDFTPTDTTLNQVCMWGFYRDSDPDAPATDCGPVVIADHFRVRVFNNDPATGRSPFTLSGETTATSLRSIVPNTAIHAQLNSEVYAYELTLDQPITGLNAGQIYWLEISNDLSDSLQSCRWYWTRKTPDSSSLSFQGTNDGYGPTNEVAAEQAFCTNFEITPSTIGSQTAPCCNCMDSTCSLQTLFDCTANSGIWDITETSCDGINCPGIPSNDHCASGSPTFFDGIYVLHNHCARTDGYNPLASDVGTTQLHNDLWYYYITPSSCDLVFSTCATTGSVDSALAVYHTPGNPTVCPPCPLDEATNNATLAGIAQDESCEGEALGGGGVWVASEQLQRTALPGECFLVRVGGANGSRGLINLDISCGVCRRCEPTPLAVVPNGEPKTRFISFDVPAPATAGVSDTAIRIKLTALKHVIPSYCEMCDWPFTAFEGQYVYAGPPLQVVESSMSGTPFWVSFAQCTPHYRDWSTVDTLHVTGPMIVPSSNYTVDRLPASCQGSEETCTAFVPGPDIKTRRWGDVAAPFNPPSPTVQPDISDVSALVDKFRNAPGALSKAQGMLAGAPGNFWGEITPMVLAVDFGFSHIAMCVDAFRGSTYPYRPGKCTGAPTPPATGACGYNSECTGNNGAGPCLLYCP